MADSSSWWWPWKKARANPASPTDGAHDPALRKHFTLMLDYTEPPLCFRPSDVAKLLTDDELRTLGYQTWRDALPAVRVLAWDLREFGDCVIQFKDGTVVPRKLSWMDVEGPVRFQRRGKIYSDEYDWDDNGLNKAPRRAEYGIAVGEKIEERIDTEAFETWKYAWFPNELERTQSLLQAWNAAQGPRSEVLMKSKVKWLVSAEWEAEPIFTRPPRAAARFQRARGNVCLGAECLPRWWKQ